VTARRLKLWLVLTGVVLGALTLLAWTQSWVAVELGGGQHLTVAGQAAAPALSALGLAGLALAAALSIAGRVLRVILGVVQAGMGVLVIVTAASTLARPVAASAATVTEATGVSGAESVAALVMSVAVTSWPWIAVVVGAASTVVGLAVVLTSSRWPGPARKYETTAGDPETRAGSWDALSEGKDPT
jgi:hypothetical protein